MFEYSLKVPSEWEALCQSHGAIFHSAGWQHAIESAFGIRTVYAWNQESSTGLAISVFRAGPFRIGYAGFPAGGWIGAGSVDVKAIAGMQHLGSQVAPQCIRLLVSGFDPAIEIAARGDIVPETMITDLQQWSISDCPDVGRNLRKAQRVGVLLDIVSEPCSAEWIANMYRQSVARQHGTPRYDAEWFHAIIEMSRDTDRLRCWAAVQDDKPTAFLVAAHHGDTAFYLHGGGDARSRQNRAPDLLMYEAITWAQSRSARRFNFMSSPPRQPSLVRYKEKWGGETRPHTTYTVPVHRIACASFRSLERLNRGLHRLRRP